MGRFLFVVWDGGGNVPQPLALGRRLVERGHNVDVLGSRTLAERFTAAGCSFTPFKRTREFSGAYGVAAEEQWDTFLELLSGERSARDVLEAVESRRPDVAFVDCMLGAALAALESVSVETAVFVHVLFQPWATQWGRNIIDVNPTRELLGLVPLADSTPLELIARARATLVMTPAELDLPGDVPPGVVYTGQVLADEPHAGLELPTWPDGDELPLVVASMSTTYQHQEGTLALVLGALEGLPVRVLVTLGPNLRVEALRLPANAVAAGWIPHRSIFPEAALVVTHAGLGTVLAALACGVPLLCLPLGREQPLNAERVQELGAGLVLSPTSSEAQVRGAAERLLTERTFRDSAERMATITAGYGDGLRAVEALEALLP